MKSLGILAGLGPLAGAHFYRRVIELSPAISDEEHVTTILISDASIPSRMKHLNGQGPSPVPKLIEVAQKLIAAGADILVIPSTTTNLYYDELTSVLEKPIINLIDSVTKEISIANCHRVGVLGTTPTRTFQIYERAFAFAGIEAIYPDNETQSEVMEIISQVKSSHAKGSVNLEENTFHQSFGHSPSDAIYEIAKREWKQNVDAILLACTELPVIFPNELWREEGIHLYSSTDILAAAVVEYCYGFRDGASSTEIISKNV